MAVRTVFLACCVLQVAAFAQQEGAAVNGLQIAIAVEGDSVVMTFHNVRTDREMFLPLGLTVGVGHLDFVGLALVKEDGTRLPLRYTGGSGVAPGRLLPYIVPMMPGSRYSVRTSWQYWRSGKELLPIDADLKSGASLQATIDVSPAFEQHYVNCFGLRMFWSGRALSNLLRR